MQAVVVGDPQGLIRMLGGVHGEDEAKVYRELCEAADEWIKIYGEDGDPLPAATAGKNYSGNSPSTHNTDPAIGRIQRDEDLAPV
jgi:predicted RNase H-like HicB family nuclease